MANESKTEQQEKQFDVKVRNPKGELMDDYIAGMSSLTYDVEMLPVGYTIEAVRVR